MIQAATSANPVIEVNFDGIQFTQKVDSNASLLKNVSCTIGKEYELGNAINGKSVKVTTCL